MCATIPGAHMSLLCILFCSQNMGVTMWMRTSGVEAACMSERASES